ncbi:MAG: chromosomal replication initiator protein DnaA [Candidatus Roizmanbacteria bacterium]|nr:chromosomal replication initiator protein DnaA [Candidatus Roizmanbacteria bacterium]
MTENRELWEHALSEIELYVSKANFGTWFRNTIIIKEDGGTVFLGVPNAFVKDWLQNKYHIFILKALRNRAEYIKNIEYVITKGDKIKVEERSKPIFKNQLEFSELYVNKEDNLNPKYTFDTFVVGSFNETAHAAVQAILKNLGTIYNPLFIYGGTGLGKTHLIQAVGNQIKKDFPDKKVYYMTSEKFVIEVVNSIQNNRANAFKEKYRKYDLFIMDDVQFIANKDRTQEELFHLFNSLHDQNKQIIFSSDKIPKYIPNLEERLRSRFEGGMIVDISLPDYESRLAILNSKLKTSDFTPSNETVEYVASVVKGNIRELEGALNTIICQCQLKNRDINLTEVKNLIKNTIKPQKTISIKDVLHTIANFYNIEEKILCEKTRRKEVVKPRQIIMYILREDFNISYPYIGQKLGGRDHTTVMHAYEKIKNEVKTNNLLIQEVEQIRALLYNN